MASSDDDGAAQAEPQRMPSMTANPSAPHRRDVLPTTRQSVTHKFSIAGHEGYLTVGLFEDGRCGEIFIATLS